MGSPAQQRHSDTPSTLALPAVGQAALSAPMSPWEGPAGDDGCGPLSCAAEFGSYRILEELGRGGMGVVYRAYHVGLHRTVALKLLARCPDHEPARQRFAREVELAARLKHPGIVTIYETGEHQGRPFYAMELIEGPTLGQHLAQQGPLAPRDAAQLVLLLAQALQHAHEHRVLHRDLKPSNVLLDADGRPHIADFGLSRALDVPPVEGRGGPASLSEPGMILGTPAYMAPEQAGGRHADVGPAADVYALGVILYECLTGRTPFQGGSALETLRQIEQAEPVPPSHQGPVVPPDLEAICLLCLRKSPRERYPSAAELAGDLQRFLAGEAPRHARLSWVSRLGRALASHHCEPRLRWWARRLLLLGVAVLATQALVTAALVWLPGHVRGAVLTTHLGQPVLVALGLVWFRPREAPSPSPGERALVGLGLGLVLGCFLDGLSAGGGFGPATPQEELAVYPRWCVLSTFALLVAGTICWGGCYLASAGFGALALAAPGLGLAAPLAFGLLWAVTLTALAWQFARLGPDVPTSGTS